VTVTPNDIVELDELAKLDIDPGARILRAAVDVLGRPLLATAPAAGLADTLRVRPTPRPPFPLSILRLEGTGWRHLGTVEVDLHAPHVQVLSDDRLLVVGSTSYRSVDGLVEANAVIFAPDGAVTARFTVGDGVEDVQTTAADEIWVSYFDDGTMGDFGRFGWGRLSPEVWIDPIGRTGLRRYDGAGTPLYEFAPPTGVETIADCVTLNVTPDGAAWISYHPRFPLVRIPDAGEAAAWSTDWDTVDALAVLDARVLYYGRFKGRRDTCRVAALGPGPTLTPLRSFEASLPHGRRLGNARWVIGRGAVLHAVDGRAWHTLTLASV
jgi:hypothetical protein